jgi:hypothetical protein
MTKVSLMSKVEVEMCIEDMKSSTPFSAREQSRYQWPLHRATRHPSMRRPQNAQSFAKNPSAFLQI